MAYGNNFYLGVGSHNTLVYTPAVTSTWYATHPVGVSQDNIYRDVVFADGKFVFVGVGSNFPKSYALSGTVTAYNTESIQNLESFLPLSSVTHGESLYVAVGERGQILSSTNGINWSLESNSVESNLYKVRFTHNLFIAVGEHGIIETSSDGHHWTVQNSGTSNELYDICFFNGQYFVSGSNAEILLSPDGVNWSQVTSNASNNLNGMAAFESVAVAVGDNGEIERSTNGSDWSFAQSGITLVTVDSYAESYWAIGSDAHGSDIGVVMTSNDGGNTWHTEFESALVGVSHVFYGNGVVVITTFYGSIITSTDSGKTWQQVYNGQVPLLSGIYANGLYIVVGVGGTILTSTDAVTFTQQTSGTSNDLRGVAYNNGVYVAVGDDGTILYSKNGGQTWVQDSFNTNHAPFRTVNYANGIFLASGNNGQVFTSVDGVNWTPQLTIFPSYVSSATFGNGNWYIVGEDGVIETSNNNGSSWIEINSGTHNGLATIISNIN